MKVRIPLAFTAHGEWAVEGSSDRAKLEDSLRALDDWILSYDKIGEYGHIGRPYPRPSVKWACWIEVDVPVPGIDTITGHIATPS